MQIESNRADILLSSRQKTSAAIQEPPDLHRQKSPRQIPAINTYKSATKQTTLSTRRMNTYTKTIGSSIRGISTSSASRMQIRSLRELGLAAACSLPSRSVQSGQFMRL
jgi:hypothetical protein